MTNLALVTASEEDEDGTLLDRGAEGDARVLLTRRELRACILGAVEFGLHDDCQLRQHGKLESNIYNDRRMRLPITASGRTDRLDQGDDALAAVLRTLDGLGLRLRWCLLCLLSRVLTLAEEPSLREGLGAAELLHAARKDGVPRHLGHLSGGRS